MATVLHRLMDWAQTVPDAPAQRFKANGEWKTITAREYRDRVLFLALFFEARGHGASDTLAILAYNSPEWTHADLGAMLAGVRSAGLYPNSAPKDIQYILEHTGATCVAVQNKDSFKKLAAAGPGGALPERIRTILVFDGDTTVHPSAVAYEAAIAEGRRLASDRKESAEVGRLLSRIDPKRDGFLIYTSGTTGNPKGALLSHDNLVFTSDIVVRYWRLPTARGSMFSFLPLCHIAEKLQSVGVAITQRYTVSYCTKFENVGHEMVEVQPTLLLSVPRLWEKMMEGVIGRVKRAPTAKRKLAEWALACGTRVAEARGGDRQPSPVDLLQLRLADRLVLSKMREALGLGRAELIASGAAALPAHVSRWFRALGLEILEDYGQTESTGVVCMTEAGVESSGTVGKPVPGIEFKIAEDGEIITRGRHVFIGYLNDEAATAQALEGGWLHTGDLGEYDSRGRVRIRGRKKEVLKTSGGKMIAPLPIEEKLKASDLISQACIVGDGRKYLSALITLSDAALAETLGHLGEKADAARDPVINDPFTVAAIKAQVDALNKDLAGYEQIKRFTILSREFSIEDGEMTATMKMKRPVIEAKFKDLIDRMYSGGGE